MARVAVMTAPGAPIEVREVPLRDLAPGGILLETLFSEVCGTDVHLRHGRLAGVPYPIVPGHVSVGRVAEVAGVATDLDGRPVRVGDLVTFHDVHATCHACRACLVDRVPNRCPDRKVYGITYGVSDGLLGGWAEAIELRPGVTVLPLPDDVPPERLIAGGCGLATALHALDRAAPAIGDRIVVQGAGPVGLSAAALALLAGAGRVTVVGGPANRLEVARALGIDAVVPLEGTTADERVARVRDLHDGRGADITIEATGVPGAVVEGMRMTRDGGRLVVAGQYTDAGDATFNPHADLNRRHLEVRGVWGADAGHFARMVEVLARHGDRIGWERMVGKVYGLDELDAALDDVEAGRVVKAVVRPRAA